MSPEPHWSGKREGQFGGGGGGELLVGTKTLSADQILAFDGSAGTNVLALAAPGAGFGYVVQNVVAILRPGSTPFADGDSIFFGTYGTTGAIMESILIAADMHQTVEYASMRFNQTSAAVLSEFENCPLVFNNFGVPYSAGNGTLEVTYSYWVAGV